MLFRLLSSSNQASSSNPSSLKPLSYVTMEAKVANKMNPMEACCQTPITFTMFFSTKATLHSHLAMLICTFKRASQRTILITADQCMQDGGFDIFLKVYDAHKRDSTDLFEAYQIHPIFLPPSESDAPHRCLISGGP
ncbi:hypothetical protein G6F47_010883 [Rhizopus delemar]|nr:hypothetical protein G6F54_010375 [Rhizopus delemar]KAG1503695.1 hypothetical protein G6F53_010571 [Rhizopus delemar]KAG1587599.1 hypothetical protein G6F47_010883 [Rhizopus delemar]KAG1638297.1 hypothetical protein G6F44_008971 [Rhizopus delemar]